MRRDKEDGWVWNGHESLKYKYTLKLAYKRVRNEIRREKDDMFDKTYVLGVKIVRLYMLDNLQSRHRAGLYAFGTIT